MTEPVLDDSIPLGQPEVSGMRLLHRTGFKFHLICLRLLRRYDALSWQKARRSFGSNPARLMGTRAS
jgi:hypothetical protein